MTTMRRPRYRRINNEVSKLLSACRITAAPVPVKEVAEFVGAKVQYRNFNNEVSGVLIRRGGLNVIGVADEQSPERQRFTIAHELGHLLLHEGDEVHIDRLFRVNFRTAQSSLAEDVEEIEANAFAASLLMPIDFIRRDLLGLPIDVEFDSEITTLAKKYQVSAQAMSIRLSSVYFPSMSSDATARRRQF